MNTNFTNFFNYAAKEPQNTGGGNSQTSTLVATAKKGSRPTVNRQSTDGQSQGHYTHTPLCKALKYAAMLLMILTLGIGNAWGNTGDLLDINFTEWYNNGGTTEGNAHYIHSKSSGDYLRSNVAYFTNSAYSKTVPSATNYVCVTCSTSTYNVYAKNNSYLSEAPSTYSDSYTVTHNSNTTAPTSVVFTLSSPAIIELLVGASSIGNTDATYGYTAPTANATKVQREYHFLKTYSYATGSYPLADEIQLKTKDAIAYVADTTTVAGTVSYEFDAGKLYSASGTNNKKFYIYAIRVTSYSATPPSCSATANAGADKSTTVGVGVAMAATAATSGYTGAWSIKAGSPSTATSQLSSTSAYNATFTPSTYGTYTLVWTVTDDSDGSCSASDEATVTVPAPTHAISYTNTKDAANSNPATYTEGVGVASFANLRHVVGYDFTGWSPSSISSSATTNQTIEAQWTANAVAEGTGSLTYALAFGSGTVTTSSITRVNGALYDATDVSVAHTSFDDNANKNGCSGKLHTTEAKDGTNYVELTFKVADGYTFTPTEVRVKGNAVSTAKTLEVELKDNADTPNSKSVTGALADGSTDGGSTVTLDFDASGEVALEGTVTAKIFVYGATNAWRLGTSIVISGTVAVPATPCDATAPGDIEKGEASGGTGKITLKVEDDGAPVSGDAWYWQSSASGEDDEDEYDAENGKEVDEADTYYLRSYNTAGDCWSAAKSVEVTAADLLTAISPTLSYDANVIVGNTASPTLTGNAGSGAVTYALNDVTPAGSLTINESTGVVTAVTAGGTATVTATIAANGNYAAGSATSETITVVANPLGTHTITWTMNVGTSASSTLASSVASTSTYITATQEPNKGSSTSTTGSGASDRTIKVTGDNVGASRGTNSYVEFAFSIADGYQFTPSAVSVKVANVTTAKKYDLVLSDASGSKEYAFTSSKTDGSVETASWSSITGLDLTGNCKLRVYGYYASGTDGHRFGTPITITGTVAVEPTKYNLTFAAGTGASGSMATLKYAASTEVTLPACTFTAPSGKEFDAWVVTKTVGGASVTVTDGAFTMPAEAVTATATWKDEVVMYAITKGSHTNGDFTIAPTSQEAGETVTLSATPNEDYVFSAWSVVKTEDGSATGITVSNNTFTMPAYGVTVNATFAADPRSKVLYVTSNTADATKSDDKVYAALKDTYNVKIVGPTSDADQSGYALVVLHESLNGGNDYNKTAVAAAKIGTTPVLNTKAYFYNSGRWAWGTPNAGKKTKGVHVNTSYCNITNHPLFNDLTPDANDSIIILSSISGDNKPIQPIGSFTSGKEGYTLANVPDGCAIHELTPAQRGAESGKYLLISLYTKDFANLNANGQKLFQNAAAYLIGNTAWEPVNALSSPAVTASPSAAYSVGDNIALTASATGSSAATTYTWYKGDTWAAAEEAGAIQAAETAENDGNIYGITGCALGDAGTYWCVISNGTGCEVSASLAITVSDIAYDITFVSSHGTAPTATTGVSYTLPELSASGWEHQGWTASIDVTVDAATVTTGTKIANGKIATFGADVTFTAVWAEVFDVTFNMQSHGASIAAQHIVDGGKATEPNDPSAIGWDFGGWFTDAECTEGNEFDFNTAISADTELFAKWTAFTGCTELWPATSGDALHVGDNVSVQSGSKGGTIAIVGMKTDGSSIAYNANGLALSGGSADVISVTLNNDMTVGTKISVTLAAANTGSRGLDLLNSTGGSVAGGTKLGWDDATIGAEATFSYTVTASDGLDGTNIFRLKRNNTVYLKCVKVESCGDAIIYHDLTSAISPDHDPAYATVTLGASSVREGRTTTATYSAINAAYEFDEWQISGTGATLSSTTANPVTITMGTADAVVTLKLKAATPKHTVTFNKMGKGDDIASQSVKEGDLVEEPTVTEPEGWILEGWYTENTFETKWDFAEDVMSTSDIELFANWVADTSIKLLSGSTVNHTDFITGVSAETVEISSVNYDCVKFSGTVSNVNGVKDLTRVIAYNAKTNKTKIQLHLYNTSTSSRTVLVKGVLEGNTSTDDIVNLASITLGNKEQKETEYIEFNNAANRTIYIFIGSSAGDVRFLQVRVIDDGATPMKAAGQAGYSLNLNKGRFFGPASTDLTFEGLNVRLSGDYTAMNSGYAKLASTSMSFTVASAMTLNVTTNNNKTYYVTKGSAGTDNETAKTGVSEFDLTAGTWYISAGSNEVQFTNIAFIAPKCEAPAFNSLANSDICEGDDYVALDGTATVADAGTPIYQWYNAAGDEAIDGATSATYTPTADGSYYVIATNQLSGYTDNTKQSATVTVTTHAGTAITEGLADQRGNVDDVVALAIVASGKNLHYTWKECATIDGTYTAVAGAADAASLNVTITENMDKYYKVVVSSDCGVDQESVAHVTQYVPVAQANVTGSIVWNWANAASVNEIKLTASTSPKKNEGFVMANGAATIYNNANFESDKLYLEGEYIVRDSKYFQGQTIKFNTTVAGAVRVKFSHTGNSKPARELYINGVGTGDSRTSATAAWSRYVEVPAGEVSITAYHVDPADGAGQQYIRVPEIEFYALDQVRSDSWIAPGELGTVCYPNGHIVVGADMYQMAGVNENGKFAFDQVEVTEPGVPYLFEATGYDPIKFYKTTAAAAEEAGTSNGMVGTFVQMTLSPATDVNAYYFQGTHFYAVTDRTKDLTVPAYRCYVDLNDPHPAAAPRAGVRRIAFGVKGTNVATGMEEVTGYGLPVTEKILINGQLFILRGEKMYDATGRLVK